MNGILLIDKPKEYTSHDIVAMIKKITGEKVGHTGTLDPNATGVLPLLIGAGTKISKYLVNHDKTYIATLKLGIKTDTADGEGIVIQKENKKEKLFFQKEEIEKALASIVGKQQQLPPMYSAIKVNGKKLYEYARQGKKVEVEPRRIEIYNIELLEYDSKEAEIIFKVACSKGTYIRTVCEKVAENLHTIGYMKELERTQVGKFFIQDAVDIEVLKNKPELINERLIKIEELFKEKEEIRVNDKELALFLNGVQLTKKIPDGLYRINHSEFIGLGIVQDGKLKRDVII